MFGWQVSTDRAAAVCLSRIHADDRRRVLRLFTTWARHGSVASMQFRLQRADGTIAQVLMRAFVVRDHDGKAIRSVGSLTDITDDIRAREALEAEVAERRRAEQVAALHTATLSATLDSMLLEPRFDTFAGQVLNSIVEQLGAIGGSFWVRDPVTERIRVTYVHDGGRLLRGEDSEHPLAREQVPMPVHMDRATGTELNAMTLAEFAERREVPESVIAYLRHRSVKTMFGMRLLFGGDVLGGFTVYFTEDRAFAQQEQVLAKGLMMQATLALKLARMEEETRHAVVIEERNRMARDIHDTLAQGFTGVIIQLEAAKEVIATGEQPAALHHIQRAADLARSMLAEARRSVHSLRPIALEQIGLRGAFLALLDKMTDGTGIESSFILNGHPRALPLEWEEALLRIGQEALTNALRHASMRRFAVTLTFSPSGVELTLADDGVGFNPDRMSPGMGLAGMRERIERLRGELRIASHPATGTTIMARLHAE
jgi:signal transduction histidine kinase